MSPTIALSTRNGQIGSAGAVSAPSGDSAEGGGPAWSGAAPGAPPARVVKTIAEAAAVEASGTASRCGGSTASMYPSTYDSVSRAAFRRVVGGVGEGGGTTAGDGGGSARALAEDCTDGGCTDRGGGDGGGGACARGGPRGGPRWPPRSAEVASGGPGTREGRCGVEAFAVALCKRAEAVSAVTGCRLAAAHDASRCAQSGPATCGRARTSADTWTREARAPHTLTAHDSVPEPISGSLGSPPQQASHAQTPARQ